MVFVILNLRECRLTGDLAIGITYHICSRRPQGLVEIGKELFKAGGAW